MSDRSVKHRFASLDGVRIFYREAGSRTRATLLLPHGYPCSSFEFRHLMPALADRWHVLAPDFPGFGYSDIGNLSCDFEGYTTFLERFVADLGIERFALYLHDYGSQIGLRLAIRRPEWIGALVIQNGDIYEDALGPKYRGLLDYFADPTAQRKQQLVAAVSEEGFKDEFLNDVSEELIPRISPDLWKLHWPLMNTPERRALSVNLMEGLKENLSWFPRYQAYLREQRPPTLIVWGPQDGYMPQASALAYRRDLPEASIHLLEDGGHWLLETHLDEVVALMRDFLERHFDH